MSQIFHPSTNTISRVSIFGALFVVAAVLPAMPAINRSSYVMQAGVVPTEEDRHSFVIPESMAALHAYLASPLAEDGLYALIDVGAGSTDISFLRFTRSLPTQCAFSAARSETGGADNVDRFYLRH